jgi:hypothetical protein
MLRSSRNLQPKAAPQSSSLDSYTPTVSPTRRRSIRRLFGVIVSALLLYILVTIFKANASFERTFDLAGKYFKLPEIPGLGSFEDHNGQVDSESTVFYDPHIQKSDLKLELTSSPVIPGLVTVTLTNLHPQTNVELLLWDSPFDPEAAARCVFQVTDVTTGKVVPCEPAAATRPNPLKSKDFLEFAPQHAVTQEVTLGQEGKGPTLRQGREYEVMVKSRYRGVWRADLKKANKLYLFKTGGGSGMIDREYESNSVRITA